MIKTFREHHLLILIISFISVNNIISQPLDYVGYWQLNGNTTDSGINKIDGIPSANLMFSDEGIVGQSAYFDGSGSDYINLGNDQFLNINKSLTVSAWIKLDPNYPNTHQMILSKDGSSWYTSIYNQKVFLSLRIDGSQRYTEGNIVVSAGEWHHIACSWNANTGEYRTYLDGAIDVDVIYPGDVLSINNLDVFIGNYDGSRLAFNGNIDELVVYNRALSTSEINYLYENPRIGSEQSQLWQSGPSNIYHLGNVAIGRTDIPSGFNFAVDGKIISKEVKVSLDEWADFVFEPDYELMPLEKLESYINFNNHLPSFPSENKVIEEGLNLGEMDAKLLQKIEELTLYLIEQNKRIKKLEKKNDSLVHENQSQK